MRKFLRFGMIGIFLLAVSLAFIKTGPTDQETQFAITHLGYSNSAWGGLFAVFVNSNRSSSTVLRGTLAHYEVGPFAATNATNSGITPFSEAVHIFSNKSRSGHSGEKIPPIGDRGDRFLAGRETELLFVPISEELFHRGVIEWRLRIPWSNANRVRLANFARKFPFLERRMSPVTERYAWSESVTSGWTRAEITAAQNTPLAPLLRKRGLQLIERGDGTIELPAYPDVTIWGSSYWIQPQYREPCKTLDFYELVLGLKAYNAMREIRGE